MDETIHHTATQNKVYSHPFTVGSRSTRPLRNEGEVNTYRLRRDDKVSGKFTLTDTGFDWRETSREYAEPKKNIGD